MVGTRRKLRRWKQSGNYALKGICWTLAIVAGLVLAYFLGPDRNKIGADTAVSAETVDFSSLAATVVPLAEFGANGKNIAVVASAASDLLITSGLKSNFMQMTSLSGLVSKHAAKIQHHLESGLRYVADTETKDGEAAAVAASWRPAAKSE